MNYNVLDTGAAFSIYAAGGTSALDTLFRGGARVVVTEQILGEIMTARGAAAQPTQLAIRDWINENRLSNNVVYVTEDVSDIDARAYIPGYQMGQNFDRGDVSIIRYLDVNAGSGGTYQVITDNYRDFRFAPDLIDQRYGYVTDVHVTPSTYGYLAELLFSKDLDADQYRILRDNLDNSGRAGNINSALRIDDTQLSAWFLTDIEIDIPRARQVTLLWLAAKEAGWVGDLMALTTTALEVSHLYETGQHAKAEAVMGAYIGGLAGGTSGAFGGAMMAAAVAAILTPEPSSTVVGIVMAAGAVLGGLGGGALGEALAESLIETLQERMANGEPLLLDDFIEIIRSSDASCFLAGTSVYMWPCDTAFDDDVDRYDPNVVLSKVWRKPIEDVAVNDRVVSFSRDGGLRPGRVKKRFFSNSKIILDFFGTFVTPGHVYRRVDGDGTFAFEPLIDILRSDGVVQAADGKQLRATTGLSIDDSRDRFVWAITGTVSRDGSGICVHEKGQLRLGTRFITADGRDFCIADLIEVAGGMVTDEGLIRVGDVEMPFHWSFGEKLPKPEDYILQRSGTTLVEIYRAAEWEGRRPSLPAPLVRDNGPVQPLSQLDLATMPRNMPLALRGGAYAWAQRPMLANQSTKDAGMAPRKPNKEGRGKLH